MNLSGMFKVSKFGRETSKKKFWTRGWLTRVRKIEFAKKKKNSKSSLTGWLRYVTKELFTKYGNYFNKPTSFYYYHFVFCCSIFNIYKNYYQPFSFFNIRIMIRAYEPLVLFQLWISINKTKFEKILNPLGKVVNVLCPRGK